MKADDIQLGSHELSLVSEADVDAAESRLWVTYPAGYRQFITRFGEGTLGDFVEIKSPSQIENELAEWRRQVDRFYPWDNPRLPAALGKGMRVHSNRTHHRCRPARVSPEQTGPVLPATPA